MNERQPPYSQKRLVHNEASCSSPHAPCHRCAGSPRWHGTTPRPYSSSSFQVSISFSMAKCTSNFAVTQGLKVGHLDTVRDYHELQFTLSGFTLSVANPHSMLVFPFRLLSADLGPTFSHKGGILT